MLNPIIKNPKLRKFLIADELRAVIKEVPYSEMLFIRSKANPQNYHLLKSGKALQNVTVSVEEMLDMIGL